MNLKEEKETILEYFRTGNYQEALNKGKQLLKKDLDDPNLYNIIGLAYLQLGDIDNSIINFENSLKLLPDTLSTINNIANAYKKKFDYAKAEAFYLLALKKGPNYLNNLVNFANFKMDINQVSECINIYKKVLTINSENHLIYFNLATAYKALGNFEETKTNAEKALKLKPDFTIADKLISSVTTYTNESKHFLKLKKDVINVNIKSKSKFYLHFALAKAYFDNKQFTEFFNQMELGNKLKRESINYDSKKDLNLFKNIKLLFTNVNFKNLKNIKNTKKLIFVLGMPRSGTSLVEQIISSHSKVFGAGELPFLLNSFLKKLHSLEDNKQNNFFSDFEEISENYNTQTSILNSSDQITLDKSPLNFLLIGFIRILFPQSKVIHVKRGSKDTCFSCYKNLFDHGLNFTYNKKELAFFYNSYDDLMQFWNRKLGNFIYTINYENLVNDSKNEIKKVLNFCNLEFEDKCLNFYKNKSPIKTLSALQARKEIYQDSIKSYKFFDSDLGDIFDNLKS